MYAEGLGPKFLSDYFKNNFFFVIKQKIIIFSKSFL